MGDNTLLSKTTGNERHLYKICGQLGQGHQSKYDPFVSFVNHGRGNGNRFSFSEDPPFLNKVAAPYDLRLNTSIPTGCESGGTIVPALGCNLDFNGDPRFPESGYTENPSCPATAPDVGADEFDGIQPNLLTWTGTASPDWSDPGNWYPAMVPGEGNSVVIPSSAVNTPLVLTNGQSCKDLIIHGNASVTVFSGVQLMVNGHIVIRE